MKVFFLNNGTTHYYNLVLNRLQGLDNIELTVVVPKAKSTEIGDGVYQTRTGISFRVLELEERVLPGGYASFRGFSALLLRERPAVIITADIYLLMFVLSVPVAAIRWMLGIKLIMKSIPFRVPLYQEALRSLRQSMELPRWLPRGIGPLLKRSGMLWMLKRAKLELMRLAYRIPDAHVNYVDAARDVYGSYGVDPGRIFITRNSPDTDTLFAVRHQIETERPILPPCEHRLIHVGRLVAWKRVDMLLRAFCRVRNEHHDAELIIIGTGPEEATLKELSTRLGLAEAVRFLGGIYDPVMLGRYLMASSVYVLAGMGGLSINEAMCFGLPVICSVCDGTEKLLVRDEENGKYFRDGDEDDLIEKIGYLFNQPERRRKMGIRSTEIIKNDINIQTVIRGYQQAIVAVVHADRGS